MISWCLTVPLLLVPKRGWFTLLDFFSINGTYGLVLFCLVVPSYQWPSFKFWSSPNPQPPNVLELIDSGARFPRVLNFFPIPVEEECLSEDKRLRGICMNTYECRIQHGKSHGPCALGFGVCCIFTTTCGGEVQNNLTYVTSPGFPNLIDQPMNCTVAIKRIEQQISQLRIDFLHFNIGQPNRRTGVCDEDVMEIRTGNKSIQICGWNSGQHIYADMTEDMSIDFRLPRGLQARMWEMRIEQLPFAQRAPAGCLQYFQAENGTLKTLNYLPNGRFLASQDYLICVKQKSGMCSISYAPCTSDSFRIGPPRFERNGTSGNTDVEGSGSGPEPTIQRCRNRVLIPCDFEEFITGYYFDLKWIIYSIDQGWPGNNGAGICDLEHCGSSLCGPGELDAEGNCRVETSASPFHIRVAFGPGEDTGTSLEDNVGMCLNYEQLPCVP